jgi:DNA-binding MarR family transcriptional regulator
MAMDRATTENNVVTINVEDSLVFWLKKAYLAIRKEYDEELAKHELTYPQWEVMRMLCSQDGLEQRMIQQRLGIQSATLTGIVDGLVDNGMVERRLSPEDARVKQLHLTEEGQKIQQLGPEVLSRIDDRLSKNFSPAELALLKDWLRRVIQNIEEPG